MLRRKKENATTSIANTPELGIKKTKKPTPRKSKNNAIGAWLTPEDYDLFIKKRDDFGFTNSSAFLKTIINYDHISVKNDITEMKNQIKDLHQAFEILITDINKVLHPAKTELSSHSTSLPINKTKIKEE